MKRGLLFLILVVSVLVISGCYYDVAEELYPSNGTTCDTSSVTYSLTVKPIIDQFCVSCHSQGAMLICRLMPLRVSY
jgi:hypothetical protein